MAVMQARPFLCAVRTKPLYTCNLRFILICNGRAMPQAVSHRPVTAKTTVRFLTSPREICGGLSGTGPGFSPSNSVFPYQYYSTNVPYPSLSICLSIHLYIPEGQTGEAWEPSNKTVLSRKSGALERKIIVFLLQKVSKPRLPKSDDSCALYFGLEACEPLPPPDSHACQYFSF